MWVLHDGSLRTTPCRIATKFALLCTISAVIVADGTIERDAERGSGEAVLTVPACELALDDTGDGGAAPGSMATDESSDAQSPEASILQSGFEKQCERIDPLPASSQNG